MVKIRKTFEAKSKVGKQGTTLRISIPQEITKFIQVKSGDTINWIIELTKKPVIKLEIIESEDDNK